MLRERLESSFQPSLRDCYQVVKVMPPLDEVQLEQEKTTLIITRPGGQANGLPIAQDWQDWWQQQAYKNRVLFLSGSKDTYIKILDAARQSRALVSIEDELRAESTAPDDPQWRALDSLRDRIGLQFTSALKETFDQLVYPSRDNALRFGAIVLEFAGNTNGEATIRETLKAAKKFTTEISDDTFRSFAEARLFGVTNAGVALWNDVKRAAATRTDWPLHKTSALEDLKAEAIRRDLWLPEGNYVRKGPFPPPTPSIEIRELSRDDDGDGRSYLQVSPLHCDSIVYESGDSGEVRGHGPAVQVPGLRQRASRADQRGEDLDCHPAAQEAAQRPWRSQRGGAAGLPPRQWCEHPLHNGWFLPHQQQCRRL
jgi:hypothetical protein